MAHDLHAGVLKFPAKVGNWIEKPALEGTVNGAMGIQIPRGSQDVIVLGILGQPNAHLRYLIILKYGLINSVINTI